MVVGTNSSKTMNLLEIMQIGSVLARGEGLTIVGDVFLRHDAYILTSHLILLFGMDGFMRI